MHAADGPFAMARISHVAPLTFTAYREAAISEGRYLLLFHTSRWAHCVGLEVDASGLLQWYDSDRDSALRCATDILPHVDSRDLVRVALKGKEETTTEAAHPSAEPEIRGRLPAGNRARKRGRDDTDSEGSDGYVSGADSTDGADGGGIEGQVTPTALLSLLRKEIEAAANDAKTPYARGPRACRLCPIRVFDRRSRLRSHIEKITTHRMDQAAHPPGPCD